MASGRCATCLYYARTEQPGGGGVSQVCEFELPKHVTQYQQMQSPPGPDGQPGQTVMQLLSHSVQRPTQADWGCSNWAPALARPN